MSNSPQENKFELALKVYNRAFGVVEGTHIHKDEDKEACKDIRIVLHLNMALCHLKLDNGLEARGECNKVLELDEENIKALFRRGQVRYGVVNFATMHVFCTLGSYYCTPGLLL